MVFYQQSRDAPNSDLIEIKDSKVVREIENNLNITPLEKDEIAPIICGSVINNGQWQKKLRMLRADLFSSLCICQSASIYSHVKQSAAIKKGTIEFVNQSQANVLPDTELYCRHWERILYDKCMNNTVQDT